MSIKNITHAFLLLELVLYLALGSLVLLFVSSFLLNSIKLNKHLEQTISSESALHNACILFQRDQTHIPKDFSQYIYLQRDKISFLDTQKTATITWYFDHNRFMRSCKRATGVEHAVVLSPASGSLSAAILKMEVKMEVKKKVQFLELQLSHNVKSRKIKLWLY